MKKTVNLGKLKIGEGTPKVCVPIIGKSKAEIIEIAKVIKNSSADFVEWRADYFESVDQFHHVEEVLIDLKAVLGNIPILFTIRTLKEGGYFSSSYEEYFKINKNVIEQKLTQLIDIEYCIDSHIVKKLIEKAKENNICTIISKHNFEATPKKEEIIDLLGVMQKLDGDIIKIAVMPKENKDVLVLMEATEEMVRLYADKPIISVSMSSLGLISRLAGEVFGSAVTFATIGEASAPGQIEASKVADLLKLIHGKLE